MGLSSRPRAGAAPVPSAPPAFAKPGAGLGADAGADISGQYLKAQALRPGAQPFSQPPAARADEPTQVMPTYGHDSGFAPSRPGAGPAHVFETEARARLAEYVRQAEATRPGAVGPPDSAPRLQDPGPMLRAGRPVTPTPAQAANWQAMDPARQQQFAADPRYARQIEEFRAQQFRAMDPARQAQFAADPRYRQQIEDYFGRR